MLIDTASVRCYSGGKPMITCRRQNFGGQMLMLEKNRLVSYRASRLFLAERVGFEPTVRENRTPDFESGPFDHSGTSPNFLWLGLAILLPVV